jgi:hypothetical protein
MVCQRVMTTATRGSQTLAAAGQARAAGTDDPGLWSAAAAAWWSTPSIDITSRLTFVRSGMTGSAGGLRASLAEVLRWDRMCPCITGSERDTLTCAGG